RSPARERCCPTGYAPLRYPEPAPLCSSVAHVPATSNGARTTVPAPGAQSTGGGPPTAAAHARRTSDQNEPESADCRRAGGPKPRPSSATSTTAGAAEYVRVTTTRSA